MDTKSQDGQKTVDHPSRDHADPPGKTRGGPRSPRRFIGDHPAACLAGALAIGFLVARLVRRKR